MSRITLTERVIARAFCPCGKNNVTLWDAVVPGLGLRVLATGGKSWTIRYRAGRGRSAPQRSISLGDIRHMSVVEARRMAKAYIGKIAQGEDPSAERKAERERDRVTLAAVLERYDRVLDHRGIVKREQAISALRRQLVEPVGHATRIDRLTRAMVIERIEALEQAGKPGAAAYLRQQAAAWLSWCADVGLVTLSPLAGVRRPAASRAQRLAKADRALDDQAIVAAWRAAEQSGMFGKYCQLLLLTGLRKQELARAKWSDLDGDALIIPAAHTKTGREHHVPLSWMAQAIIDGLPRTSELLFPSRFGKVMTGQIPRLRKLHELMPEDASRFQLHDLRRTLKSHLSRLSVPPHVSELVLNHRKSDALAQSYDGHDFWHEQLRAVDRWADHLSGIIEGRECEIVPLRRGVAGTIHRGAPAAHELSRS